MMKFGRKCGGEERERDLSLFGVFFTYFLSFLVVYRKSAKVVFGISHIFLLLLCFRVRKHEPTY